MLTSEKAKLYGRIDRLEKAVFGPAVEAPKPIEVPKEPPAAPIEEPVKEIPVTKVVESKLIQPIKKGKK